MIAVVAPIILAVSVIGLIFIAIGGYLNWWNPDNDE